MSKQITLLGQSIKHTTGERCRPQHRGRAYLLAFVAGGILSVALLYGALATLLALDRLPPPPVSGTWCIDGRFAWLKQTPQWKEASLIAVGSSATWRNLDFSVTSSEMKHRGIVNAAPCFLTANQTRYLTEYLVQRASAPKTILTVLTPRDFEGCSRNRTTFFDPDIADQYLDGKGYEWWLYFRNFRLRDVLIHAIYADQRRPQMTNDQFGSGPLTQPAPDIGHAVTPEPRCYSEITRLATFLESRGIQFIVATFPVMQGWASLYDDSGTTQEHFKSEVESALASTKAILVDGMSYWEAPDSAFTDPVHLQWPETADFTRFIWRDALYKGAKLPPLKRDASANAAMDSEHKRIGSYDDRWGHLINYATGSDDTAFPMNASISKSDVRRRSQPDKSAPTRRQEPASSRDIKITTPLLDAITQNTRGYSEGFPAGVPRGYSWCSGSYKPLNSSVPPPDFTAVTGWGQVYPKAGAPAYSNPNAIVEIANAQTYVHLKETGEWVLVQDQADLQIQGSHFVADFSPKAGIRLKPVTRPDGSVAIDTPPAGYNDHFWFSQRGAYRQGSVDGVYVQMNLRTNDTNMNLIANIGADWWRDPSVGFVEGFANNPGAGMSNWVQLSTEWSTLRFYSWSTAQLQANPPPPLAESAVQTRSNFTRRFSRSTPYCLPGPRRQTE